MKKIAFIFAFAVSGLTAFAQITVTDFSSFNTSGDFSASGSWAAPVNQFTLSGGILTVGSVSGGNPIDSDNFAFSALAVPFDGTPFLGDVLTVAARIDSGNVASGFVVNFFDSGGNGVLTATFSSGSFSNLGFTAVSSALVLHPNLGVITDIVSFGIAGVGNGDAFRFSFDSIVAGSVIPEPSTYAAILGLLALGFVAYRRRLKAV